MKDFNEKLRPQDHMRVWGDEIWRSSIQPRRSLTVWKALHDRLATEQLLKKKGLIMPSCCRFRYKAEEDIIHIFLQCDFVNYNGTDCRLLSMFGLLVQGNLTDLLLSAFKTSMSAQVFSLWISGIISTIWIIYGKFVTR